MVNDRSQQEKKKIPKDDIIKIKPWVDIEQKRWRISGGSKKNSVQKPSLITLKLLAEFYFSSTFYKHKMF